MLIPTPILITFTYLLTAQRFSHLSWEEGNQLKSEKSPKMERFYIIGEYHDMLSPCADRLRPFTSCSAIAVSCKSCTFLNEPMFRCDPGGGKRVNE